MRIHRSKFQNKKDSDLYWEAVRDFRDAAVDLVRLYTGDTERVKAFKAAMTREAHDAEGRCENVTDALACLCSGIKDISIMFRDANDNDYSYDNLRTGFERAVNLAAEQSGLEYPIVYQDGRP